MKIIDFFNIFNNEIKLNIKKENFISALVLSLIYVDWCSNLFKNIYPYSKGVNDIIKESPSLFNEEKNKRNKIKTILNSNKFNYVRFLINNLKHKELNFSVYCIFIKKSKFNINQKANLPYEIANICDYFQLYFLRNCLVHSGNNSEFFTEKEIKKTIEQNKLKYNFVINKKNDIHNNYFTEDGFEYSYIEKTANINIDIIELCNSLLIICQNFVKENETKINTLSEQNHYVFPSIKIVC